MDSGTLIAGRYRLERVIASGGMGSVWRAQDERLERDVAVKVLHPGLDGAQRPKDRFEREAKALASLKGPGCVEVYDFGEEADGDRDVLYLVMELVEGVSLAELLHSEQRLDPARTMRIVAEAAEALAAAHQRGIVHRDVKPGNILIDADDRVRVVDFGISLLAHRPRLTPTDGVLGTAPYVSPEQLRDKGVTGASDLYSLGAVAYECLTGAPPFDAADPASIIHGHLYSEPPALPGHVPAAIAGVVTRTLRKAPEERWPSGEVLAAACRAATTGEHPVAAAEAGPEAGAEGSAANGDPTAASDDPNGQVDRVEEGEGGTPADEVSTVDLDQGPVNPPFRAPDAALLASEPTPPGAPERNSRRRRLMVVGAALVVVLTVLAVAFWNPWGGDGPVNAGEGDTASSAAESSAAATTGEPSPSDSPTAGETATESAAAQEETSAEDGGGEANGGGTDEGGAEDGGSDEGDEGDTGDQVKEGSGTVPSVTGMTTFEARDALEAEGFTNVVANVGYYYFNPEPEHCQVMMQSPRAGQTVDYAEQISVSYHERQAVGTACDW
ncbi:protein kinase [Glycomyces sp. A-F 0318]|uniref:serine/threonine-protein kinase n=1 Tax=Glycomyces amatae TaxID=2881355 RepID=UPI001E4E1B68|nr:protein kinase [Glycomyces amatae]